MSNINPFRPIIYEKDILKVLLYTFVYIPVILFN